MPDIKDYLEIVIITYNRASFLKSTLESFAKSPFSSCKITVLDNASTDDTKKVARAFVPNLPSYSVVTNKLNIGGNANILRALETSGGLYTWIVADDDHYDFSDCGDLIRTVIGSEVNLIHAGGSLFYDWKFGGRLDTPRNLIRTGYHFFANTSFIPCNIFRTKDFYPFLASGYENIGNWYPHMPFLFSFFSEDKNIYITSKRIILRGEGRENYHLDQWIDGWLRTALWLRNKKDRILYLRDNSFFAKRFRNFFYCSIFFYLVHNKVKNPFFKIKNLIGYAPLLISIIFYIPCLLAFSLRQNRRNRKK